MRLLTIVDQLFLLLESRKQPMHVGGLFLFELPADAKPDFVQQLVEQMQSSTVPPTFPFDQVLHKHSFWKEDPSFQVKHHFRHIALPQPAHIEELLAYVSKEHSRLMNRARPLWECHMIEGLEPEAAGRPKRFALYFKVHHSLVDGVAAMRLIEKTLSQSPTEIIVLPIWSLMLRHRYQVETLAPPKQSLPKLITEQLHTIKPVVSELATNIASFKNSSYVKTTQAPACILNQKISGTRQFTTASFDMAKFKYIASYLNMSINDVVLALCSGALRRYLLALNELPDKPLIAWVPFSMRSDDSVAGNQFSFILCDLGTHLANPLQRLRTIHRSMNDGKQRFGRMNQAQVINYSLATYSWEFVNVLTNAYPKKQAFNLIISNITGSEKPLYWNGATLKNMYPASIIFDGQALNITLASYLERIEFGILACNKTLPNTQSLLTLVDEELGALEKISDECRLGVRE